MEPASPLRTAMIRLPDTGGRIVCLVTGVTDDSHPDSAAPVLEALERENACALVSLTEPCDLWHLGMPDLLRHVRALQVPVYELPMGSRRHPMQTSRRLGPRYRPAFTTGSTAA